MHSSRMRTVRCSGRLSCHAHPHACHPTHMPSHHACPPLPRMPLLWTEFLTHACENITFPQLLLRTVKKLLSFVPMNCKVWSQFGCCNSKLFSSLNFKLIPFFGSYDTYLSSGCSSKRCEIAELHDKFPSAAYHRALNTWTIIDGTNTKVKVNAPQQMCPWRKYSVQTNISETNKKPEFK